MHLISLSNREYATLTPEVIRVHWRSQEIKRRSTLKNAPRDPFVGMYNHVISLTYTVYGILTLKVIRGHNNYDKSVPIVAQDIVSL